MHTQVVLTLGRSLLGERQRGVLKDGAHTFTRKHFLIGFLTESIPNQTSELLCGIPFLAEFRLPPSASSVLIGSHF